MVVDGVNGARGSAHLNYRLTTVAPSSPPSLLQAPASLTVVQGSIATFEVRADGSAPLVFQWFKDGSPLDGATLPSLTFATAQPLRRRRLFRARQQRRRRRHIRARCPFRSRSALAAPGPDTAHCRPGQPRDVRRPRRRFRAAQSSNGSRTARSSTVPRSPHSPSPQPNPPTPPPTPCASATPPAPSPPRPSLLSVLVPPSLLQAPAPLTVVQGSPATFDVRADGSAPLSFQWFKDGSPLDGATLASLTFATAQPSDAAAYSVRVSNAAGAVTSAPVVLSVLVPPSLLQAPTPLTVVQGNPATFDVRADGSAPLSFQWFKEGSPLDGATFPSLPFAATQPSDAAAYSVRVSNAAGAVTSVPVVLSVLIPPSLLQASTPLTVVQGSPATFDVRADGSAPLSFQWFKDGSLLDGATLPSLTFAAAQPSDAAAYSVRLSNAAGAVTSAPVVLSVLIPPSLLQAPTPLTVVQGNPATFDVRADGSAPLSFQWFKDGSPLDGATLPSLPFATAQPSDAASYSVRVSNAAGAVTSAPVVLSVLIPPSLLQAPTPLTVVQGSPATFDVRADGSEPLSFQWFKGRFAHRRCDVPLAHVRRDPTLRRRRLLRARQQRRRRRHVRARRAVRSRSALAPPNARADHGRPGITCLPARRSGRHSVPALPMVQGRTCSCGCDAGPTGLGRH
jgi:hypothetical protein